VRSNHVLNEVVHFHVFISAGRMHCVPLDTCIFQGNFTVATISVSRTKGWKSCNWGSILVKAKDFPLPQNIHIDSRSHSVSWPILYRGSFLVKSDRNVKLASHLHVGPMWRIPGPILQLSAETTFPFICNYILDSWSQWPRGLKHELSSPAQTPGSWVRIPLKAWMSVYIYSVFTVLYAGSGLTTGWSPVKGVLPTV
jgi:hypothetical protein